jgi:hypothetical protein
MNDIHREDPESIWKQEIADEITALKTRVNVLMRRRGGYRVSPSAWREIAINGLNMLREFEGHFSTAGHFYRAIVANVNAANDLSNTLDSIDTTLKFISMAQLQQAGVAEVGFVDGQLVFVESKEGEPQEMRQAGTTKEHKGANAWEFIPPAPYTGVVIVCAADETAPLGMRCYAEAKLPGGVRRKYPMPITEVEENP